VKKREEVCFGERERERGKEKREGGTEHLKSLSRDAEVCNDNLALLVQEDIAGLEVSMDDDAWLQAVEVGHASCDARSHLQGTLSPRTIAKDIPSQIVEHERRYKRRRGGTKELITLTLSTPKGLTCIAACIRHHVKSIVQAP